MPAPKPAHLAPREDRHWILGAVFLALGIGLFTAGALGFGSGPPGASGPSRPSTTEVTVLGVTVTGPDAGDSLGPSPAAVPATFETGTTTEEPTP